jgi:hypothetical protein
MSHSKSSIRLPRKRPEASSPVNLASHASSSVKIAAPAPPTKKRTRIEFQGALTTTAIATKNAPKVMRALRQLTGPQRSKVVPSITYTKMVGVTGAIPASASTDLHLVPAVHTHSLSTSGRYFWHTDSALPAPEQPCFTAISFELKYGAIP